MLELSTATESSLQAGAIGFRGAEVVLIHTNLPESAWRNVLSSTEKPCILLGSAHLERSVIPLLIAGAKGHLLNEEVPEKLREAVETVLTGNIYAGPVLTWRLLTRLAALSKTPASLGRVEKSPNSELTICESKILNLIANGMSNQSIADTLSVSPHTVANHVHSLLKKLRARNRWEAVEISESPRSVER